MATKAWIAAAKKKPKAEPEPPKLEPETVTTASETSVSKTVDGNGMGKPKGKKPFLKKGKKKRRPKK